jgi:hypothetical protein
MANLSRNWEQAAQWAQQASSSGRTWSGLCDRYVANVYGQAHSGYESALVHWGKTPANLRRDGDRNPPIGALVYWRTGKPAGHVAVVVGKNANGEPLISTTHTNDGVPTTMTLDEAGMQYLGWAVPYFQGKTAKLDPNAQIAPYDPTAPLENNGLPDAAPTSTIEGDYNNDGVVNQKDKTLRQDDISWDVLEMDYETAWRVVDGVPELRELLKQAVKEGWDDKKFSIELEGTKWYGSQESSYAAEAWFAKEKGGKNWEDQVDQAAETVQRIAASMGAEIPDTELAAWGERYIFGGWMNDNRKGMMMDELARYIDPSKGSAATVTASLKKQALDNGITLDEGWFKDVAKSIARGESASTDWDMWIRKQAADRNPLYAEQLMAGVTMKSITSPYRSRYADLMGEDAENISLDNPDVQSAIGQVDEKGKPKPMSYADFDTMIRKKPEWLKTEKGSKAFIATATRMAQDWGFISNG